MKHHSQKAKACVKSAEEKETEFRQKICEAKGLIDDEQQVPITGYLHKLTEFMSDEDRRKFESGWKAPPGV